MNWRPRNIRTRLTLWYVGTLAVVLIVYAVVSFLLVWHSLSEGTDIAHELNELAVILGLVLPVALGVAGFGGYAMARRTLAPVSTMTERARTITAEKLNERLPVDNPDDEIGQLATVFNETLSRLDSSFEKLRRFTADASHELRTPLTAMRSVGEVGLSERRTDSEYREIIGSMLEEVERLTRLVDTLLTLARADAGRTKLQFESVNLDELVRDVVAHLSALTEEKKQTVRVSTESGIRASVDRAIVRQAVVNLLDNAIKYSPAGSEIRIAVLRRDRFAVIEIIDAGPGIDPVHIERVFDRFYRVDDGRSRDVGGLGLGLSIAQWAAHINGGSIEVESVNGRGSTFRLQLTAV